jgi:glycosyltransferase involved in cell wall biosynthesis
MKILHLCNKIPYPPIDGGAIAVLNLARLLAEKGHEVWIMAMNTGKHRIGEKEIPEELLKSIHFVYFSVDSRIRPLKLMTNLIFSAEPYNAVRFHNRNFAEKLTDLLNREKFDIIQMEGLYLKWYISTIRKNHAGKIVYRAHNIESEIWTELARQRKNPVERSYFRIIARRMRKYEQDMINRYDLLLPISEHDEAVLESMGNIKPSHITHTHIPDAGFHMAVSPVNHNLFFIGALDWIPNQEGLIWFLEKVWQVLKKEIPQLEFHIAGRNAPGWIGKKCKRYKAVFHGEVASSHDFFDRNGIMIVPLFAGSGLRIKIIEAMARSKAIVSTSKAVQGLPLTNGKEILIEDDERMMKESICKLLEDPGKCLQLQKTAYDFVSMNFRSNFVVDNLLYFYCEQGVC